MDPNKELVTSMNTELVAMFSINGLRSSIGRTPHYIYTVKGLIPRRRPNSCIFHDSYTQVVMPFF